MSNISEKLSAYLDGELTGADAAEIEALVARDPAVQAELETLMQADTLAREVFAEELDEPVSFTLAQSIKSATMEAPEEVSAPSVAARPIWGTLAAGLAALMIGGVGGYILKGQTAPVETAGWLQDIADYHAVYSSQKRHLVEVGANEADHIEAWLGKTIGAPFAIPDLSAQGLTFEGGRLLVANGAPVAQLMYRNAAGEVIALCLQGNTAGASDGFKRQTINSFDFVSWRSDAAKYVVIGPENTPDLDTIAEAAAVAI